jgi:hypothetical protein
VSSFWCLSSVWALTVRVEPSRVLARNTDVDRALFEGARRQVDMGATLPTWALVVKTLANNPHLMFWLAEVVHGQRRCSRVSSLTVSLALKRSRFRAIATVDS